MQITSTVDDPIVNLRQAADVIEANGLVSGTRQLHSYNPNSPVCALGAFETWGAGYGSYRSAERFPRTLEVLAEHIKDAGSTYDSRHSASIIADWSNKIAKEHKVSGADPCTPLSDAEGAAIIASTMRQCAAKLESELVTA